VGEAPDRVRGCVVLGAGVVFVREMGVGAVGARPDLRAG
jgi:hypothetical protein